MRISLTKAAAAPLLAVSLMTGCATNQGPEYDGSSYNQIKQFEIGTVVAERPVVVKDDGMGTFLGALIGTVVGSTMGGGRGTTLMALGGGLAGGYAGSEIGKANAEELTVELDYGEVVVIVVKGMDTYHVGDRIKIIKDGNRVAAVEKLESGGGGVVE